MLMVPTTLLLRSSELQYLCVYDLSTNHGGGSRGERLCEKEHIRRKDAWQWKI
jgi:hypothetical protein